MPNGTLGTAGRRSSGPLQSNTYSTPQMPTVAAAHPKIPDSTIFLTSERLVS